MTCEQARLPRSAFAIVEAMRPIAGRRGVSVARVALAWLLHEPVVTSVIIGATRVEKPMTTLRL